MNMPSDKILLDAQTVQSPSVHQDCAASFWDQCFALLWTDSMAATAESFALGALTVILSMNFLRPAKAYQYEGGYNAATMWGLLNWFAMPWSSLHKIQHSMHPHQSPHLWQLLSSYHLVAWLATVMEAAYTHQSACSMWWDWKKSAACMKGSNFLHQSANEICLMGWRLTETNELIHTPRLRSLYQMDANLQWIRSHWFTQIAVSICHAP